MKIFDYDSSCEFPLYQHTPMLVPRSSSILRLSLSYMKSLRNGGVRVWANIYRSLQSVTKEEGIKSDY